MLFDFDPPCMRFHRYGPVLESVVTITEDLAYEQAKRADELLARDTSLGNWLLHLLFPLVNLFRSMHHDTFSLMFSNPEQRAVSCI